MAGDVEPHASSALNRMQPTHKYRFTGMLYHDTSGCTNHPKLPPATCGLQGLLRILDVALGRHTRLTVEQVCSMRGRIFELPL